MANSYDFRGTEYNSRPRANSSNSSRYIPAGYVAPTPAVEPMNDDYLAPPASHAQQQAETLSHQPVNPEQYRRSSRIPRDVPPAQLSVDYPESSYRDVEDYARRPSSHGRHASVSSQRSGRSHRSSRSHHSHGSHQRHSHEQDRQHHYSRDDEVHPDRERDRSREHHHQRRSGDRHSHDDKSYKLTRKDTPRGYGSTLFAIGGWIKSAWKGS